MQTDHSEEIATLRDQDDDHFFARVRDNLVALEVIRQAKLKIYNFRKKIAIPVATILTPVCGFIDWWLLKIQSGNDNSAAGITVVMLGLLYSWVTQPKRDYAKQYKTDILPKLAAMIGLSYDDKKSIDMALMKPSKIVPHHDRYKTDDYFEGSYKGVKLSFSEIELQERRRSNKRTYYATVFKGLAVLLHMNRKKFFGHTILTRDQKAMFEWLKEKTSGLKRADLVDPEFEKIFDVYTNDQTEARYLIDPAMVEELKTIYADYEGERMMAAYFDDKMLILIASKHNHFEPAAITVPATSPESMRNMRREIVQIMEIIDRLDLYDPAALTRDAAA